MNSMMNDYAQYLGSQGIRFEDYIQMMGGNMESFRESTRSTAEKQTRTEMMLRAVAEAEKIEISEDDLKKEYEQMATAYGMKAEDVEKVIDADVLKDDLLRRKAVELITESGVAVEAKEEE